MLGTKEPAGTDLKGLSAATVEFRFSTLLVLSNSVRLKSTEFGKYIDWVVWRGAGAALATQAGIGIFGFENDERRPRTTREQKRGAHPGGRGFVIKSTGERREQAAAVSVCFGPAGTRVMAAVQGGVHPLLERFNADLLAINSVMKAQIDGITGLAKQIRLECPELIPSSCQMLADAAVRSGVDVQVPLLYVIDSIVKNVRGPWNASLSDFLPVIFDHAWVVGAPGLHDKLRRLVDVWHRQKYFSKEAMARVDACMHPSKLPALRIGRSEDGPTPGVSRPWSPAGANGGTVSSMAVYSDGSTQLHTNPSKYNNASKASNTPMTRDPRLVRPPAIDMQPPAQAEILNLLANVDDISSLVGVPAHNEPTYRLLTNDMVKETNNQGAVQRLQASTSAHQSKFLDAKFLKRKIRDGKMDNSTMWYLELDTWYGTVTSGDIVGEHSQAPTLAGWGTDADQTHVLPEELASVPADDHQTACAVSGEKFEKHWDDSLQEWRYLDVVRVDATTARRLGVPDGSLVCASVLDSDDISAIVTAAASDGRLPEVEGLPEAKRVKLEQ